MNKINLKQNQEGKPPVANNPLDVIGAYSKNSGMKFDFVTAVKVAGKVKISSDNDMYSISSYLGKK